MLENGNDAVFGTLFWFAIAGGPAPCCSASRTRWTPCGGYRNERFNLFGRSAARIDDALNYLPARLTAFSYALLAPGAGKHAPRTGLLAHARPPHGAAPNAGPVMSTGAGALGLQLGGAARYGGEIEQRPPLGRATQASGRRHSARLAPGAQHNAGCGWSSCWPSPMEHVMLEHGGKLREAAQRYGRDDWLDLSTGLNPQRLSSASFGHQCLAPPART